MKKLKQILNEAAAIELKIGDKIRTKLGGQMPGIVTKIEGQQVYFDHLTAKYQTVWSGAKDKPKQYVAHISNVIKEGVALSPENISKKIASILKNNFSNKIRVQHNDNLLTIMFDVVGPVTRGQLVFPGEDSSYKTRTLAKNLASKILASLKSEISLEDYSIDAEPNDPEVILFMVSDSFIGMPSILGKNIVKESFSKSHLDALKTAYSDLERMDPTSHAYKKLITLLNNLPQDKLKSLADANIKFVSVLAKNRIKKPVAKEDRCWPGYKPTPGVKAYEKGSCMKEQEDIEEEAEHDGKKVTLNKPFRTPGQDKKFAVYVRNDKGNVIKLGFGDPNMEIKRDDPERRKNYRARHNCADPGPKWKANYWSCKMWADKPVSDIVEAAPPDPKIEKWILANKERFKKQYGAEKGLEVLYAKAWDMYNKK